MGSSSQRLKVNYSRRRFLQSGVATAAAATTPLAYGDDVTRSPNERIETAVIGIGERGKYLIANLPERFRVTALCDCSLDQIGTALRPPERFKELLAGFADGEGRRCERFQDYRSMLASRRFDAVIISAPDHHHAQAAILAMQSGAHVYVEKPLAVTISEGRAIADAAKRFRRVVQVGSQQRTMKINQVACEFVRDGGLGKVHRVEERNLPGPMPYDPARFPKEDASASIDWHLFCGPTSMRPYNRHLWVKDAFQVGHLTWRGWDLFEDYSGHLMTNWGAHSVDMIQYALGMDDSCPSSIQLKVDEVDTYTDDQWHMKTPPLGSVRDRKLDRLRFAPIVMRYDTGTEIHFQPGVRRTVFYGEKGKLEVGRNDYRATPTDLLPPPDKDEQAYWAGRGHVARPHLENWLEAMTSGTTLNAPVEVGHRSVTVCHLANLARRLGRNLQWDPATEQFPNDGEANQLLSRPRRSGFELPEV